MIRQTASLVGVLEQPLHGRVLLLPVFGNVNDETARKILTEHFPDREIISIPAVSLTENGGAMHCVTQQQPAV